MIPLSDHLQNRALLAGLICTLMLAFACSSKPDSTQKPTTETTPERKKADPGADHLKQRLVQQQKAAAKNDGERMGYYLHGQTRTQAAAMANIGKAEEAVEEPEAPVAKNKARRGNRRPGFKKSDDLPTGTINTNALGSVFRRRQNSLQSCYERGLKRNPDLRGKVKLMITIRPDGKVGRIGVGTDTLRDKSVVTCMKSRVKTWTFPEPEGGQVTVAKTFVFAPQG